MKRLLFGCCFILIWANAFAQGELTMPDQSQKAGVSQRIGLTDITVSYHSPLVKGREIWGELVPFGEVWRAGANENTVVTFSTPVTVENQPLAAGAYGLHMIPGKDSWVVIFSKNSSSWGSYFYDKSEDALRIEVTPEVLPMQEWLSYSFSDITPSSAEILMHWEKIGVSFSVKADVPEVVYRNMKNELRGSLGFAWEPLYQAANYCLTKNMHLDDAIKWVDQSISIQPNFLNLETKSKLLTKEGKIEEANTLHSKALELANEAQLNTYGYNLLASGAKDEALTIFKLNVKRNPGSWNAYDSLAETQLASGDIKNGLANYEVALSKAPDNQKKRIQNIINKIKTEGK